jgi:hypothetical protein
MFSILFRRNSIRHKRFMAQQQIQERTPIDITSQSVANVTVIDFW